MKKYKNKINVATFRTQIKNTNDTLSSPVHQNPKLYFLHFISGLILFNEKYYQLFLAITLVLVNIVLSGFGPICRKNSINELIEFKIAQKRPER